MDPWGEDGFRRESLSFGTTREGLNDWRQLLFPAIVLVANVSQLPLMCNISYIRRKIAVSDPPLLLKAGALCLSEDRVTLRAGVVRTSSRHLNIKSFEVRPTAIESPLNSIRMNWFAQPLIPVTTNLRLCYDNERCAR